MADFPPRVNSVNVQKSGCRQCAVTTMMESLSPTKTHGPGRGIQQSFPAKSAKNDKTARSHASQPAHTAPVREWSKNRLIPFARASNVIVTASCMRQHFVVLPAKPKSLSFLTIINVRVSPTRSK